MASWLFFYIGLLQIYWVRPQSDINIIDSPSCIIPTFETVNHDVLPILETLSPWSCTDPKPLHMNIVHSNKDSIWIDSKQKSSYSCCYRTMQRNLFKKENRSRANLDLEPARTSTKCTRFNSTTINAEGVEVECTELHGNNTFKVVKLFPNPYPAWKLNMRKDNHDMPDIFIIGFGGMSAKNFERTMPLTTKYLKILNAVQLHGHTTVATDPYGAMAPVILGKTYQEMKNPTGCMYKWDILDDCNFLWTHFKNLGYRTAFLNDYHVDRLIPKLSQGFLNQPTDFYIQPYIYEYFNRKHVLKRLCGNKVYLCYDMLLPLDLTLNYFKSMVNKTRNNNLPLFSVMWLSADAFFNDVDNINVPPNVDASFRSLFEFLHSSSTSRDTYIYFLGGYGRKYSVTVESSYANYEVNLPMAYIITPERLRSHNRNIYNALKRNGMRLTTNYDIRETIWDGWQRNYNFNKRYIKANDSRGHSLFDDKMTDRNCEEANIPLNYCPCWKSE